MQDIIKNNAKMSEAISALQVLGYNKKEIEKVFDKIDAKEMSIEELIKRGLSILSA